MRREADMAVEAMVTEFRARRDAAINILRQEPRLHVLAPDGAFYLYLKAPDTTQSSDPGAAFTAHLLETAGVAVVPGSAFCTPAWVRVSYAAERSQVEEAMRRIVAAFRALT
jgi:aspartate aminotransferase